jgi:hypothetical protein
VLCVCFVISISRDRILWSQRILFKTLALTFMEAGSLRLLTFRQPIRSRTFHLFSDNPMASDLGRHHVVFVRTRPPWLLTMWLSVAPC